MANQSKLAYSPSGFGGVAEYIRHYLVNTFLFAIFFVTLPSVFLIFPIGFLFGVVRSIHAFFTTKNLGNIDKSGGDSGISDNSQSETSENPSDEILDEAPPLFPGFHFEVLSDKLKKLKVIENLEISMNDYLTQNQKVPVLVTLREADGLSTITEDSENVEPSEHTDNSESSNNMSRLQFQKRKMNIVKIAAENTENVLKQQFENRGISNVLIYFFGANSEFLNNFEQSVEDRKFVMEIKKFVSESSANREVFEKSSNEFLVVNQEGVVWVNCPF